MDLEDVKAKLKRKNQILFSRDSACLQELLQLIRKQKHRTLAMWALECAEIPVKILKEHYPEEERPEIALNVCREWAQGKVKMPEAKKAILEVHQAAKQLLDPADIALCHGVGHGCAAIHVETHAIGLPIYELSGVVFHYGIDNCEQVLEDKITFYLDTMKSWESKIDAVNLSLNKFLLDDEKPNKELLLFEKNQKKS